MVVLRLMRVGRTHRVYFRLSAMDKRAPRNGRVVEQLGWFDPQAPEDKQIGFDLDRVKYWLSVGAQPSETVRSLLRRIGAGFESGEKYVPSEPATGKAAPAAAAAGV